MYKDEVTGWQKMADGSCTKGSLEEQEEMKELAQEVTRTLSWQIDPETKISTSPETKFKRIALNWVVITQANAHLTDRRS